MNCKRTAISVVLAPAIGAAPFSAYANPLVWPFLAVGAVLGTAALIVTLPIRVVCSDCLPAPAAYYPLYAGPPAPAYPPQPATYYAPAYPPPAAYSAPPAQPGITYSYGPSTPLRRDLAFARSRAVMCTNRA